MKITKLTMTGNEQAFTVPQGTSSIAFHANGGDITMAVASGGDTWTIMNGQKESIDVRALMGKKLYFNGAAPGVLEIRYFDTVLS